MRLEYPIMPHGKRKDALLKRIMETLHEVIVAFAETAREGDAVAAAREEHWQAQKEAVDHGSERGRNPHASQSRTSTSLAVAD